MSLSRSLSGKTTSAVVDSTARPSHRLVVRHRGVQRLKVDDEGEIRLVETHA